MGDAAIASGIVLSRRGEPQADAPTAAITDDISSAQVLFSSGLIMAPWRIHSRGVTWTSNIP